MMRQAGRYLPEYRELRARAGGFLDLCFTPEFAAEVTLQPIRRFNFDAAIIFSDILVIPYALGRDVRFEAGEGPRLDPLDTPEKIAGLNRQADFGKLHPVFEALRRVRAALDPNIALIGFCGAPWTVATYMVAGQGAGREDHRLSARRGCDAARLCRIDRCRCRQHRLDRRAEIHSRAGAEQGRRAGQSRSAGADCRRRRARSRDRRRADELRGRPADLQSRSRHPAGNPDRACRADDPAGAGLQKLTTPTVVMPAKAGIQYAETLRLKH